MLTGSMVAIVTPMQADGSLDMPRFTQLIDWHIASGTAAIIVVGTTGESPTVDVEEHCHLVEVAVKHTNKRVPIIAGTGANSTKESIELTRRAKAAGADMGLNVAPYYNRPTQEGLFQHFKAIAEAVDLPMILYNVPGRTASDIHNDTVVRLTKIKNIVGLKDATGDMPRFTDLAHRVPANFGIYSGNDDSCLAMMLLGGAGVISVTANVAPKQMADMCQHALHGDAAAAIAANNHLLPLHFKLFVEPNPIPVKWAMAEMGKIEGHIRLPLTPLNPSLQPVVKQALLDSGILS
jgi:4-hydroxy-tetrahydrodipicolinate synthase